MRAAAADTRGRRFRVPAPSPARSPRHRHPCQVCLLPLCQCQGQRQTNGIERRRGTACASHTRATERWPPEPVARTPLRS
eukprot:scaffold118235_cov69-Phaeocystis_antarctica.AAC.3